MLNINLQNVEELLFKNSKVRESLPEFKHIFDNWFLSYRVSSLKSLRKQALVDLINSLDGTHIEKLARIFGDMIFLEKIDYHIIKNLEFSINDSIEEELKKYKSYNYINVSRNADKLYIMLWR
jgi:hypothetical protein